MRFAKTMCAVVVACVAVGATGCSTAPRSGDRVEVRESARTTQAWFERNVSGLDEQIRNSAAVIVYPDVSQWGVILIGGRFGRGVVTTSGGEQIGWAAVNTTSLGLQAGVQGFRMLVVLENDRVLEAYKAGNLRGNASAMAVAGQAAATGTQQFENGVAIYQGANTGLMAGVNVGLDLLRFEPME